MADFPVLHLDDFLLKQGNGIYVNDLHTHLVEHHNKISIPHRHDFYLTVFFTKGAGIHEIDFEEYRVVPGKVYTLNPGQVHHWSFSHDPQGYVFFHSLDFCLTANLQGTGFHPETFPFFYSRQNQPEIKLSEDQHKLEPLFEELLRESVRDAALKRSRQHSLITLIYIALQRAYDPAGVKVRASGYGSLLRNFELLVDRHFKEEKSPKAYAELLHITPKHLNRVSNEILDKTATKIITERVLLEAKRLLASQKFNVSQVADQLGYSDYSYFTRLFRKHLGINPKAFMQAYGKGV